VFKQTIKAVKEINFKVGQKFSRIMSQKFSFLISKAVLLLEGASLIKRKSYQKEEFEGRPFIKKKSLDELRILPHFRNADDGFDCLVRVYLT